MLTRPLRRFKEDTRDLHVLAETHVRILDDHTGVANYRQYLRAMYGFHAPIEEIFSADLAVDTYGFGARMRRKAFLCGYGPATGANWKGFAAIAEHLLATHATEDGAVAGARDTFERHIDWLAHHARVRAAS